MQKIIQATFVTALFLASGIQASNADEHGHGHEREHRDERARHHEGFHGDIRQFREHDMQVWHNGRWYHGRHDGHRGWWWIVGGSWYLYPAPVYPYPDSYQPPIVQAPPVNGPAQYWYYCNKPRGYYPYVAQCRTPWQAVPAEMPPR